MKHDSINEKCVRPLKKAVGKKSNKNAFVMKSHLLGLLYPDQTESIVRISKTKKKNTLFFAVQSGNHWWLLWMLWILSGGWCWQIVWRCISNLCEDIFRFSPLCVLNTKLIWTILGPPYIPCPLYQKNGGKKLTVSAHQSYKTGLYFPLSTKRCQKWDWVVRNYWQIHFMKWSESPKHHKWLEIHP